jgi:hypothetical protein
MKRTFAMTIAVLIIVSFSTTAMALELPYTLEGKVVSIDPIMRTFTMQTYDPLLPSIIGNNNEYAFTFDAVSNVVLCGQNKTFEDVNVGDMVKVMYHENEGNLIADTIIMTAPIIACLE